MTDNCIICSEPLEGFGKEARLCPACTQCPHCSGSMLYCAAPEPTFSCMKCHAGYGAPFDDYIEALRPAAVRHAQAVLRRCTDPFCRLVPDADLPTDTADRVYADPKVHHLMIGDRCFGCYGTEDDDFADGKELAEHVEAAARSHYLGEEP